jgi:hypothetical protein
MSETSHEKYSFASFEADASDFDSRFSEFLNSKYSSGWEYEHCQFHSEAGKRTAFCIFERD